MRVWLVTLLLAASGLVATPGAAATNDRTLLVFGDSLSAAYGLRADQGWVTLLQKRLEREGYGYRVVNASVSGETTAGGKARLNRALAQHRPSVVVLELGGNDGLRGLPVAIAQKNLSEMLKVVQAQGAQALLVGIQVPPNYGLKYTRAFGSMYVSLAKEHKVPLLPFMLDKIALNDKLMQSDGIHPNAVAQPRVLDNVWPHLKPLLKR